MGTEGQQQLLAEHDSERVLSVSVEVVVMSTAKHPTSLVRDHVKDALEKPCG